MRSTPITAASAATVLLLSLGGCAGPAADSGQASVGSVPSAPASSASAPAGVLPSISADVNADTGLPPEWSALVPGYVGGSILSATVSPDGRDLNAAWGTETAADEAWNAMDARLRALGYRTTAELGGEDLLVDDADQRSDFYVREGAEVNIVVIPGDQTTVMVNASLT